MCGRNHFYIHFLILQGFSRDCFLYFCYIRHSILLLFTPKIIIIIRGSIFYRLFMNTVTLVRKQHSILFLLCVFVGIFKIPFLHSQVFRDLTVGNKFVYEYSTISGIRAAEQSCLFEEVVGDTVLNGKRYAIIYSSDNRSLRFERSDTNALYIIENGLERIGHRFNLPERSSTVANITIDSVYWTPFGGRSVGVPLFSMMPIRKVEKRVIDNDTVTYVERIPTGENISWIYKKPYGVFAVNSSPAVSRTPNQYSAGWMAVKGAVIKGNVIGDTSLRRFFLSFGKITGKVGDAIRLPIAIKGIGLEGRYNLRLNLQIQFDSVKLSYQGAASVSFHNGVATLAQRFVWEDINSYKDTTVYLDFKILDARAGEKLTLLPSYVVGDHFQTFTGLYGGFRTGTYTIHNNVYNNGSIEVIDGVTGVQDIAANVVIFPQPVSTTLHIAYPADYSDKALVQIYSSLGGIVYEHEEYISSGKRHAEIDVHNVPTGIYFLKIRSGKSVLVRQVVKL